MYPGLTMERKDHKETTRNPYFEALDSRPVLSLALGCRVSFPTIVAFLQRDIDLKGLIFFGVTRELIGKYGLLFYYKADSYCMLLSNRK